MQYRIKEVVENGRSYYYPQYKKRWFWRRLVWWGGEDGHTPHTVFCPTLQGALEEIEADKLIKRDTPEPRKIIYHEI